MPARHHVTRTWTLLAVAALWSAVSFESSLGFRSCFAQSGGTGSATERESLLLSNGIRLPAVWPPQDGDPGSSEPMVVPYLATPPAVIPIDQGRQLFVDDFLIESSTLERVYHQAEKFTGNPVLAPETAQELRVPDMAGRGEQDQAEFLFLGQGGLFFDPADELFKLFYTAGWRGGLAIATSRDMVHWNRPAREPGGSNLLLPPGICWQRGELKTTGSDNCVWLDLNAKDPNERLKYLTCWTHAPKEQRPAGFSHTLHTSNGREWSVGRPAGMAQDYCSFFYNPFRKVWAFSIKKNGPRGRCRYYAESRDFLSGGDWSKSVYWTNTDRLDLPEPPGGYPGAGDVPQLYGLNAVAYESLMVGMHYVHRGPSNSICEEGRFPKLIDLEVGFSRDGFHWHRPDRRGFIRAGRTEGTWDRGYLHSTAGVFAVVGDQLIFPYVGTSGVSRSGQRGMYTGGSIGIATLRRDGFASMNAGDKAGLLTTRPVTFRGRQLFVNVDAPEGELRAAVVDDDGHEVAPFTLANCRPVTGNSTIAAVRWNGADDLTSLRDKPVRLKFQLTNGRFYSFWVSQDDTGRSEGFLAGGGPGSSGAVDTGGDRMGRAR